MKAAEKVIIKESPREAMQGLKKEISFSDKLKYIQLLIDSGFEIIDIGSIVNPKFVPQMADTPALIDTLDKGSNTKFEVLVASQKGAESIAANPKVSFISFPFSVSPTFQKKNINKTIDESKDLLRQIRDLCIQNKKELVPYIPMAFGNPYDDPWDNEILLEHVDFLKELEVCSVYFSNVSVPVTEEIVGAVFRAAVPFFPNIEFGLHLHVLQTDWSGQVEAAWDAGCRRFDGVLSGLGGCPMSNKMLGNIDTDLLLEFVTAKGLETGIDKDTLKEARAEAARILG